MVPIRKSPLPGQAKASIRVCGDYSVTVNSQLEDYRQPIPLPEDLMRKLGRGYCFSKIDLAKGVLLQIRLPIGIKSAPGYFQEIMEQLMQNLLGIVSGDNAKDYLINLRAFFKRLEEKGLRCNREKCVFAQVSMITWVTLYQVKELQNISTLKSFLASVQFYSKFLPPYFSEITETLYRLTRKGQQWKWGEEKATSFKKLTVTMHRDCSRSL